MSAPLKHISVPTVTVVASEQAKILVVDDSGLTRSLATDLLVTEGYNVLEADGGSSAIAIARQNQPDIILLDVKMPQMDGYEVCRCLKQEVQTSLIPIVFMTVYDDRQARLQGIEAGGDDFLSKPLDRLELLARVKNWISHKRLNEDLNRTEQTLFSIAKAIESRYTETSDSGERLVKLAQGFGEYLQLSEIEIQDLMSAARLHDIGTVGIPESVLCKQGELTPEEQAMIRQHVLIGETLCQPLRNFRGVLPIVRHHHERWDGSGYPDRLVGSDIPWLAQIFQTIDIYDALTSSRPYKQAFPKEVALDIMLKEAERGWRNHELVRQFCLFIQQEGNAL
ncbi:response regulator [Lusitaniella coriacea LEGE 07157]|uniref:Response regulator n=1 Tax=Lusitaniella coriacea LEGE 07157 TaxID=945747 RepID=A0A8J7B8E2_9CYAN|nr:HD domain-containing phosphohydrolase [Lusitaniella coriacea]MBE9115360.1 response regulator [Lusitaniella coriacea LEGE 07157]